MPGRERYPFRAEFEPVADCGDIIHLMPINRYYVIDFLEPIPLIEKDFGPFAAGHIKPELELDFLYMPMNELAQWRMVPIDKVIIKAFRQPRVPKWITRDESGILVRKEEYVQPMTQNLQLTEWFQFEDTKAYIDLYAPEAIPTSRIHFYGFRYMLTEVPKPEIKVPTIWYEAKAPKG